MRRSSRSVGCSLANCAGAGALVVCSFDPPGNVLGEEGANLAR